MSNKQTVVITGASSGIGLGLARAFIDQGYNVVGTARSAERLHEAFEAEAERLGLFAWELSLQLTAANPEEFHAQRLEVHREVAEMAGMPWDEYCTLHHLDPRP